MLTNLKLYFFADRWGKLCYFVLKNHLLQTLHSVQKILQTPKQVTYRYFKKMIFSSFSELSHFGKIKKQGHTSVITSEQTQYRKGIPIYAHTINSVMRKDMKKM